MADALWITEDYLMENSIISEDTDVKIITPNIIYCQDIYLKPLLGTTLFDEIQAAINAQTYTADQTTLLNDYLKKVLMYYVLHESAPDFKFRFENKGILNKNSNNTQEANLDELRYITARFKVKAEVYAERTTAFLLANPTLYPSYISGNLTLDSIQPNLNNYTSGLMLEDDNDLSRLKAIRIGNYNGDV